MSSADFVQTKGLPASAAASLSYNSAVGQLATQRVVIVAFALIFAWLHLRQSVLDPRFGLDFTQHYISGRALLDGRTDLIYDTTAEYQAYADRIGVVRPPNDERAKENWIDGVPPPVVVAVHAYPPPVVLLMAPLALLPYTAARLVWFWMSLFFMAGAISLLFRWPIGVCRRPVSFCGLLQWPTASGLRC